MTSHDMTSKGLIDEGSVLRDRSGDGVPSSNGLKMGPVQIMIWAPKSISLQLSRASQICMPLDLKSLHF